MFEFDLRNIHELLSYKNLFSSDNEYMIEANSLVCVELDTEPLYEINTTKRVLFTTKLRYYALLVEKEVNRHLNIATNLLEEEDNFDLAKFVIKKTRESVTSLVNECNRQILIDDQFGYYWNNIISDTPEYDNNRFIKELVVFHHYVIAQLARCWLELQDRYAYIIGKELYDVGLFYSAYVKRTPDLVFEIKKSSKYDNEAKNFRKCRPDCCFLYDNKEYFAIAIQEFTNKLKRHNLIEPSVDVKSMMSLFAGHPCRTTYKWKFEDRHILTWIIKGLIKGDKPIITTWPEGTSQWTVVSCRFVDETGKPFPNIRHESERQKAKTVVSDAIQALADYL